MITDEELAQKVQRDAAQIKRDLSTLLEDSSARLSQSEDDLAHSTGQAKTVLTTKVERGISQMSGSVEKLTGEARDSMVNAAASVRKDVGHGLSQYNAKVQKAANKAPGQLGKKAARVPWVMITFALAIGFILGSMVKPSRTL